MIVVHHLNFSRSTRILWLLEEIGASYTMVSHLREPGFRAPPELRAIHPFGKAPLIEDAGLVIAESAVILDYIDREYADRRFTPSTDADRLLQAELLYFAESALGGVLKTNLYGHLTGGFTGVFETVIAHDTAAALGRIDDLARTPYLFGDELTLADIQLGYSLALADYLGLLQPYARATAYLARLQERPALQRALEKGGPMTPPRPTADPRTGTANDRTQPA